MTKASWNGPALLLCLCVTGVFAVLDDPFYKRGFLVEPTGTRAIYVCSPSSINGPTRCFYSLDNGTSWKAVDRNVISVIGLHQDTKELFGLSRDRRSIMRSGNLGVTWSSTAPERYLDLSRAGVLLEPMRVPFVELSDEPDDFILATEGDDTFFEWGAASEGLYRREVMVTREGTAPGEWTLMRLWGYP